MGRGGVSPAHFFYDMTLFECAAFLRGYHEKEKGQWEQVRQLAYVIAQVNSSKELEPSDIMKFAWDENKPVEIDEAKIEELRERAKKIKL